MQGSTAIDRMRSAMMEYAVDQPDSYSFAVDGPDGFYELHDTLASAVERKYELGLLAALKAIAPLSNAMIDAGGVVMKSEKAGDVWQAFVRSIADEYETSRA